MNERTAAAIAATPELAVRHPRCRKARGRAERRRPGDLVYLNNRYHDPSLGAFISVDPLVVKSGEPFVYGAANPVMFSDPSGLEVCYDDPEHPKYGQCYEAADGEEWAMTPQEEVLTVKIMNTTNEWVDSNGSLHDPVNVRYTDFSHAGGEQIVDTWRFLISTGLEGEALLDALHLMLSDWSPNVGPASELLGTVSDGMAGLGLFCAGSAAVTGPVGGSCAGMAFGASAVLGGAEVVALWLEDDPSAKCRTGAETAFALLPGGFDDDVADVVFGVLRETIGASAGGACR